MSLADEVAGRLQGLPPQMIEDVATEIIARRALSSDELVWLIAHWELTKPRVHRRTVSDSVNLREALG